ncbi:MAG: response regulator [Nitrosomonas sp.]|jgi:CheY-like chemotaxis protein|uniref:response regulator n=1 Tax=Nitrosomonas sp. TaxID=42353 RepID=UPI002716DE4D|nr:response regulator [Nitrosomonas sp.]MDO8894521.1 response regulator [Nitrosomonas sp.]MDO9470240.1 response regulator [Nitrosomonas sp.]MDP1548711.1 response regulator [Nitrosomonas sp.]MDP1787707.1 response regulator [Nitrosomonas sp.]
MNLIQNTHQELKGFTILVVEDNELNQMVAKGLLEYNGASVAIANHGKEALEILRNETIDCVLMDIQMPVMDGLEATQMIRANAQWADLLIIAVTANADHQYKDLCRSVGMNDFLTKPINPELLVNTLLKWLVPEQASKARIDDGN